MLSTSRITLILFLLVACIIATSCSSTPSYDAQATISSLGNISNEASEQVLLLSSNSSLKKGDIPIVNGSHGIPGDRVPWHLDFELSQLPRNCEIVLAVLEMRAVEKSMLATGLGGRGPNQLASVVIPTSFFGSQIPSPALGGTIGASESTVEWKTSAMSFASVIGGTGGRSVFNSEEGGIDKWDLTLAVKKSHEDNRPLSIYLNGKVEQPKGKTQISPSRLVYTYGQKDGEEYPRLIINYISD